MCPENGWDKRSIDELEKREGMDIRETAIKDLDRDIDITQLAPDMIRPPHILLRTLIYMEEQLMDKNVPGLDPTPSWKPKVTPLEKYVFVENRIRTLTKEIKIQGYDYGMNISMEAITILERSVRYHIVYSHRLNNNEGWSNHYKINNDQLTTGLMALKGLYSYAYQLGMPGFCKNESEFRAYEVLYCNNDPRTSNEKVAINYRLANSVADSPEVLFSLKVSTRGTRRKALWNVIYSYDQISGTSR